MRKRVLAFAAVVGLAIGGGALGMQSASAACEGNFSDDPRRDGNEVAGVYVGEIPLEVQVAGNGFRTDEAWVEVQDDGEKTPVAAEWGWKGHSPVFSGIVGCSDGSIDNIEDNVLP